jgi:hypothetical protein
MSSRKVIKCPALEKVPGHNIMLDENQTLQFGDSISALDFSGSGTNTRLALPFLDGSSTSHPRPH